MSADFALFERFEDLWKDKALPFELDNFYQMKSKGVWTWLSRHGKYLEVDLLAAADFLTLRARGVHTWRPSCVSVQSFAWPRIKSRLLSRLG